MPMGTYTMVIGEMAKPMDKACSSKAMAICMMASGSMTNSMALELKVGTTTKSNIQETFSRERSLAREDSNLKLATMMVSSLMVNSMDKELTTLPTQVNCMRAHL